MKHIICSLFVLFFSYSTAFAAFTSCGAGYILTNHNKIDGIAAAECQKLWCRDLETGNAMGSGRSARSGYRDTAGPVEICDVNGTCIECFGERKWCNGETPGVWNPEYGAYTRGGADNATFQSVNRGGCFAWQLEKPVCENGMTAILHNGEWVCSTENKSSFGGAASSIRRTGGSLRRLSR